MTPSLILSLSMFSFLIHGEVRDAYHSSFRDGYDHAYLWDGDGQVDFYFETLRYRDSIKHGHRVVMDVNYEKLFEFSERYQLVLQDVYNFITPSQDQDNFFYLAELDFLQDAHALILTSSEKVLLSSLSMPSYRLRALAERDIETMGVESMRMLYIGMRSRDSETAWRCRKRMYILTCRR